MTLRRVRSSQIGLMLVAVAFAAGLARQAPPASTESSREVLILHSSGRGSPLSVAGEREIPRLLERELNTTVDIYSEFLDRGRFSNPEHLAAFEAFLKVKYAGHRFDVVIAVQDAAIAFVARVRETLFDGTPVVYLSTTGEVTALDNATGVIADVDLAGTVSMALDLQPELRQVFVVSGASERDRYYEQRARRELAAFEGRLAITWLSGLATADLERRLAALPDRSMVYYLLVYADGAGQAFTPLPYLDRVVAAANAPTYSWSESAMDHGIVGGLLLDHAEALKTVAGLVLRVIRGERAADIAPASPAGLMRRTVDWRAIERWGIAPSHVSSDVAIRFRDPTLWDRYRDYIIVAAVVMAAQTVLIVALLVQRAQRRRAEAIASENELALRSSHQRVRDLGGRLLGAQESERARIARELHDDVSQQVALLEIDLELLGRTMPETAHLVEDLLMRTHGVAMSLHDLSHRLHPAKLRLIGLVPALQGLQTEFAHAGLDVTFTHANVPSSLPPDVTLCLFRIAQEGLQNAVKYSRASRVSLSVAVEAGTLRLTVADDGVGFDVQEAMGKGLGLISMSERLEVLGGRIEIASTPGAGTRLDARLPLPEQSASEESIAV